MHDCNHTRGRLCSCSLFPTFLSCLYSSSTHYFTPFLHTNFQLAFSPLYRLFHQISLRNNANRHGKEGDSWLQVGKVSSLLSYF